MATTYIGYQTPVAGSGAMEHLRQHGTLPPDLAKKVNEFPSKLPPTCKLVGSWGVSGNAPNIVIVEAESYADLFHIDMHYAGWILFDWHPCQPMQRNW